MRAYSKLGLKITILSFLSLYPLISRSGPVGDALLTRDAAYKKYYQDIKKLGDHPSDLAIAELRSKTIEPASMNYSRVFTKERESRMDEIREAVQKVLVDKVGAGKIPEKVARAFGLKVATFSQKTSRSNSESGLKRNSHFSRSEETVLDGINVPKEIEFSGKKTRKK
jgi:hypothetical protein